MTWWQKSLTILLLCGASFGMGRYLTPNKIVHEIEEKIIEVTKEVVKEVGRTQTHIIETTFPDGRTVKETFILDEKTVVIEKDKFNEVIKKEKEIIENSKPQWAVGAGTGLNLRTKVQDYSFNVDRRILGNIWGSLQTKTDSYIGVALKVEF